MARRGAGRVRWLEHRRRIRFGADGERGVVRGAGGRLELTEVAEVGDGALVVHDARRAGPGLAFEIAHRAARPTGPTPIGVFRDVDRPVYGENLQRELEQARAGRPRRAREGAARRRDLDGLLSATTIAALGRPGGARTARCRPAGRDGSATVR